MAELKEGDHIKVTDGTHQYKSGRILKINKTRHEVIFDHQRGTGHVFHKYCELTACRVYVDNVDGHLDLPPEQPAQVHGGCEEDQPAVEDPPATEATAAIPEANPDLEENSAGTVHSYRFGYKRTSVFLNDLLAQSIAADDKVTHKNLQATITHCNQMLSKRVSYYFGTRAVANTAGAGANLVGSDDEDEDYDE